MNFNTNQFTYIQGSKTFVSEASTLNLPIRQAPLIVYLKSQRTQKVKPFFFKEVKWDRGELAHITYISGDLTLRVFND